MLTTEIHPLSPFLPSNANVLFLGSFPPQQKRWSMNFFYPNFQNDMWRIMGILFFADKDIFVDKSHKYFRQKEIMQFARETGIAIYDIAEEVHRLKDNASDAYLEVIRPTAISTLLNQLPQCRAIVATGEKATRGIITSHHISIPQIGKSVELHINDHTLPLYRMPSTSRAYPLPIEQKAAYYHSMFQELGML